MLFTSLQFILFFLLVTVVYFIIPKKSRWGLLLSASYYFYACWKVGYLALIITSTLATYLTGLGIAHARKRSRKSVYLVISLVVNLGLILFFKYFNFFNASAKALFAKLGVAYGIENLDILLPVGISFYTFQALSYAIDVYRGTKEPERHLGIFALYISFFPQLVAGPIERSTRLLPQFHQFHRLDFSRIGAGLSLMLWGFFKKLVIADRMALYVNDVFNTPASHSGEQLIVAAYFFAFQIYCDFSGYSDIAIGGAKVLGFDLMNNFDRPYAAKSLSDFWRRWHISLSTWFKDYLYIPLGGNRRSKARVAFNLFVVFLVSGLWHGAAWNFVVWGALHGLVLILAVFTLPLRKAVYTKLALGRISILHDLFRLFIVFNFVTFAWIFFRANTLSDAFLIIERIAERIAQADFNWAALPTASFSRYEMIIGTAAILFMEGIQVVDRRMASAGLLSGAPLPVRWLLYDLIFIAILIFGNFNLVEFIYFQF